MTKSKLLAGASALASLALAIASGAGAAVTSQVYGEGSTLIGPYLRVVENCYGHTTELVTQGAYPYGAGTSGFVSEPALAACATPVNASVQLNYLNSGSGNGELGVFTHDVTIDVGNTANGTADAQNPWPGIQYGAGDYAIGHAEAQAYVNGGTLSQTTGGAAPNNVVTILPPGSTTTPSGLTYANPVKSYGNFIQFPISIDAVAIAYYPAYKFVNNGTKTVAYSFHINKPNSDGSGGLALPMPIVCAIFNGAITNWNDPALQAANGGVSLMDPTDPAYTLPAGATTAPIGYVQPGFSVPIQLDGRADSSGTTSIFYRALAAQCATATQTFPIYVQSGKTAGTLTGTETKAYTNAYGASGGKKLPSGLIAANTLGKFNTYTGSTLVAAALSTVPTPASGATAYKGDLGYIGTDYVIPATNATVSAGYGSKLNVADVGYVTPGASLTGAAETALKYIEPTSAAALKAFGTILPPQSNAAGAYETASGSIAAGSLGLRTSPEDWAEPISTTIPTLGGQPVSGQATLLANPTAVGSYPIVGTTNAFLNTCYTTAHYQDLQAFFTYYFTNANVIGSSGLLNEVGFGVLPAAWRTAILATFFNGSGALVKSGSTYTGPGTLNLNILAAGTAGVTSTIGTQCKSVTPGA